MLALMAHLAPQTQFSCCWSLLISKLFLVPGSPPLPGCMLGHAGFASKFFKYFALWFFMQRSRYFAKGTL